MTEFRIVISETHPRLTKVFVDDRQIGLLQRVHIDVDARTDAFRLEVEFPPEALIKQMTPDRWVAYDRDRRLLEPFLRPAPSPPRPPSPTSWARVLGEDE